MTTDLKWVEDKSPKPVGVKRRWVLIKTDGSAPTDVDISDFQWMVDA